MPWEYEADPDRKHKRGWTRDHAGFVEVSKDTVVGKCPKNLTIEQCRELLNTGVEYRPSRWRHSYPDRIYNIRDGVVYRATPTTPGVSYHGFPELAARVRDLPRDLKSRLLDRAEELGCRPEVEKWLRK